LKEKEAADYIRQITTALSYLHDRNVFHRDLKPENLLFSKILKPFKKNVIKLCDFGYAIVALPGPKQMRSTICGTPEYLPPEMIYHQSSKSSSYDVRFVNI